MEENTNSAIRVNNQKKLVNLLFRTGQMTKQELAQKLEISLPTVTVILNGLMETGLVKIGRILASTGGRKAVCYEPCLEAKYSVGVDASEHGLYFILLDLGSHIIAREFHPLKRNNTKEYWEQVNQLLDCFISKNAEMTEKVLDIGITIEVPMEDGRIVSDIDARTVNLELAQSCLSYRCTFRNSTKMAALAQIWNRGDSDSYVFVKLGDHVTSSLVYQGSVLDFASVNGALGCMLMTDGTHRTLEEVMGAETLFKAAMAQNMTDFNEKLDKQDTVTVEIWETYIHHLAMVLHNLNCMFGWRIVLGGMLSPLVKKSCDRLQKKLNEYAVLFPGKRAEFVFSELGEYAAGVGAAQLPIDEFLGNIEIQ